jgi:hypothetical protein
MSSVPSIVPLPVIHPSVQASNQIGRAIAHLERHPDTLVRWAVPGSGRAHRTDGGR